LTAQEALDHKWFKKTLKETKKLEMNEQKLKTFKNFAKTSKL